MNPFAILACCCACTLLTFVLSTLIIVLADWDSIPEVPLTSLRCKQLTVRHQVYLIMITFCFGCCSYMARYNDTRQQFMVCFLLIQIMVQYIFFWVDFANLFEVDPPASTGLKEQQQDSPSGFQIFIIELNFWFEFAVYSCLSLFFVVMCVLAVANTREIRRRLDIEEQVRRAQDPNFLDPELGNIQNIINRNQGDFGDNDNGNQLALRPSDSEIEFSLEQKQYSEIKTDCKECPICFQAFGKEEDPSKLDAPIVQLQCHPDHVFHFQCLSNSIRTSQVGQHNSHNCPLCREQIRT